MRLHCAWMCREKGGDLESGDSAPIGALESACEASRYLRAAGAARRWGPACRFALGAWDRLPRPPRVDRRQPSRSQPGAGRQARVGETETLRRRRPPRRWHCRARRRRPAHLICPSESFGVEASKPLPVLCEETLAVVVPPISRSLDLAPHAAYPRRSPPVLTCCRSLVPAGARCRRYHYVQPCISAVDLSRATPHPLVPQSPPTAGAPAAGPVCAQGARRGTAHARRQQPASDNCPTHQFKTHQKLAPTNAIALCAFKAVTAHRLLGPPSSRRQPPCGERLAASAVGRSAASDRPAAREETGTWALWSGLGSLGRPGISRGGPAGCGSLLRRRSRRVFPSVW